MPPSRARIERRGGLEDDADLFAIRIEGGDVIRLCLVVTAMALVLGAVTQQVLMELADHVFRDGDLLEGIEHLIHDIGVTGDLLLIACLELGDVQSAKQVLDLTVSEPRALNAGGRADTLDGGDLAQRSEFLRRKAANHAPLPFELGDEAEDLGCDAENGGNMTVLADCLADYSRLWLIRHFTAQWCQRSAMEPLKAFTSGARILFQGDSITDGNRGRSADPNHILGHDYAKLNMAELFFAECASYALPAK